MVLGDLEAQIVATAVGARSYGELFARQGADMPHYIEALHDYAETLARRELEEVPDGTYRFVDHIDGLGEQPETVRFEVAVTISGSEVTVDWTGSSAQVNGGINAPIPFTRAAVYAALRSVMASDVPNCEGFTRPIRIVAPEGTVVNPRPPAACGARGISGFRMIDCLFGALAQAVPERVTADGSGGSSLPTFAGWHGERAFVFSETLMGNWGGAERQDGQEGVAHMGANQSNVPIELIEVDYPLRIERYGLEPDSGGAGRHRGGLAIRRDYRILADDTMVSIRSDKRAHPPHGLFGGAPGTPSTTVVNPGRPDQRPVPVLVTEPLTLNAGDLFCHAMAGAGGYGDPFERDPQAVCDDVVAGKVSASQARAAYGVVVIEEGIGRARIGEEETRRLRAGDPP
jgi:N-methylhydantoinase B